MWSGAHYRLSDFRPPLIGTTATAIQYGVADEEWNGDCGLSTCDGFEPTGAGGFLLADEGVPFRDIADVIGRHLNVPIVSKSPQEVAEHFGWLAHFVGIDCPASSAQTQKQLGWHPTQAGLIPDLDGEHYFEPMAQAASMRR